MKKTIFIVTMIVTVILSSCGAKKIATIDQEKLLIRPTRVLRTPDPCIVASEEDSPNLRSVGTATSYVEKTARNEAKRDARIELANMLEVAIEGAALDYEKNANENLKNTAGTLGESIIKQFVAEKVKNSKVIKTSTYDLSDGSIQVYVCIEMNISKATLKKELENELDREGVIKLEFDRDRFMKKMDEELEEYKASKK